MTRPYTEAELKRAIGMAEFLCAVDKERGYPGSSALETLIAAARAELERMRKEAR